MHKRLKKAIFGRRAEKIARSFTIGKYKIRVIFEAENISGASVQAFKTVLDLLDNGGLMQRVLFVDVHSNVIDVNLMNVLNLCYRFDCKTGEVESECSVDLMEGEEDGKRISNNE